MMTYYMHDGKRISQAEYHLSTKPSFPSKSTLRDQRRAKHDMKWAAEIDAQNAERERKAALDMWSLIEESDASRDVKDILHRLAEGERHV